MDFSGKPMKEFVYVSPAFLDSVEQWQEWIALGLEHARNAIEEV